MALDQQHMSLDRRAFVDRTADFEAVNAFGITADASEAWATAGRPGVAVPALPVSIIATLSTGESFAEEFVEAFPGDAVTMDLENGGWIWTGDRPSDPGFSIDHPIAVRFPLTDVPYGEFAYRFVSEGAILSVDATDEHAYPAMFSGTTSWASTADGSIEVVCAPFRPSLPDDADQHQWQLLAIPARYEPTSLLEAVRQLDADVQADASLPRTVRRQAHSALDTVVERADRRELPAALGAAEHAGEVLAGSNVMVRFHISSIVAHLNHLIPG